MALFPSEAWGEVAVVVPQSATRSSGKAVRSLGLVARSCSPETQDGAGIALVDRAALNGAPLLLPAVVVRGFSAADRRLPPLIGPGITALPSHALTSTALLGALLDAELQLSDEEALTRRVPRLPPRLTAAFLRRPGTAWHLSDLARVLACSRDTARGFLHEHGYERVEYLRTYYRAEIWILLVRAGVRREVAEPYAGMGRRANFERSCHRAGLAVPWGRLRDSGS